MSSQASIGQSGHDAALCFRGLSRNLQNACFGLIPRGAASGFANGEDGNIANESTTRTCLTQTGPSGAFV